MTTPIASIRGVCDELAQRGLTPASADIFLPRCESRDEFVRVARAFAANDVAYGASHLWACRRDGIVEVTVFAGEWWQEVEEVDRAKAHRNVRAEILAVVADDVAVPA